MRGFGQRLGALALAAGVLWGLVITAGSPSAAAALERLRAAAPLAALRWELGDLPPSDGLSPAAVMTLSQSALLYTAREQVAALWEAEPQTPETTLLRPAGEEREETERKPVGETPLAPPETEDNGVEARTLVPTSPEGYTLCGRVYISNAPGLPLAGTDLTAPFAAELGPEEPQVLILHTHGSESYTPAQQEGIVWSGDYRTTDSRYNVVRVGDAIADTLAEAGISVLHDRTLYDYPSYAGSYDRSLAAMETYLAQYPSIRFILDVHRDAIADAEGNQVKVVSATDRGTAAQLSLVVGSDAGGAEHPNWVENLRLAVAVQEEALRRHPTLMRPLLLRSSRYNQHVTTGNLLVEVGSAGNSPEEAVLAGQLFARSLAEVLQARSK